MDVKTIWSIDKLHNWDKNPRAIKKDDFERLKRQIKELGQYKPLLITPDGEVLGGNMRLKAYQDLGIKDIWVSIVEPKTEAEKVKYALSDNDRAGYYVEQDLAELATQYGLEINLEDYHVDLGQAISLADVLNKYGPEIEEDESPEVSEGEPESKLGEVYQLGRHRLMCGNSTEESNVQTLLDGAQPTMVFTDPPYGVDYTSRVDEERRKGWGGIKNDDLEGSQLHDFLSDALNSWKHLPLYVCCNWQSYSDFEHALGKPNSLIVWDKQTIGLGAGYRNQHEFILFYGSLNHNSETNVWGIRRDSTSGYTHPTQKPVAISARAIKNSSLPSQIVLDLFGGSGSTLIACEQSDRTCYMMELDPKYCDVIRKRYAKFTGKEEEWLTITPKINS